MRRRHFLLGSASSLAVSAAQASNYDLFLLAGQSNMAGRGVVESQDKEPIPGVMSFSKEQQWVPAIDPLHWDKPDIAGVGIGRSFARVVKAAHPQSTIGLVPCAFGGSPLEHWMPAAQHYTNAVVRMREALKQGRLRAILWHQGEAESADLDNARSYIDRWKTMITSLRNDLHSPDVPVIVGQLGPFFVRSPYVRIVNEQLAMLPAVVPNVAFVPAIGLKHKGDDVHFDSLSIRELGRRYGHAYLMLRA
jgi:hypothetical protein